MVRYFSLLYLKIDLKGHSQLWDRADLDTSFASLKSVYLNLKLKVTLVPEVFLDFSSRKRSTASREAATTSHKSDEEREKNLWLPWPRISLSCRRQGQDLTLGR